MLGPLLFVYKGYFFFFTKKYFITVKKLQKSIFHKKKLFNERKFEKCCEAKKMLTRFISEGAEKVLTRKKSKLKVWHAYRKNSLNHTSARPKKAFFFFFFSSYFEKCFYLLKT